MNNDEKEHRIIKKLKEGQLGRAKRKMARENAAVVTGRPTTWGSIGSVRGVNSTLKEMKKH